MRIAVIVIAAAAVLLAGNLGSGTPALAQNDKQEWKEAGKTFTKAMRAAQRASEFTREHLVSGAVVQSNRKRPPTTYDADFVGDGAVRTFAYDDIYPERAGKGEPDYLSFGYWMRDGTVGAFVEGRAISGRGWAESSYLNRNATRGFTATYTGTTVGLYSKKWGKHTLHERSRVVGEMTGTATFSALLGAGYANSIRGSIKGTTVVGTLYKKNGETESWNAAGPSVALLANINTDGTFDATGQKGERIQPVMVIDRDPHKLTYDEYIAIPHDEKVKMGMESWNGPSSISVAERGGNWGGKFSSSNGSADGPRFVVGTYGGWLTTGNGSKTVVIGSFQADNDKN